MSGGIIVYTDGGARPNPGEAAYGLVVFVDGSIVKGHGNYLGDGKSNNYAEYHGIMHGLREIWAHLMTIDDEHARSRTTCTLYSDSELAIKQLRGEYKVRSADLMPFYTEACEIMNEIKSHRVVMRVEHVLRARNTLADDLVRRARSAKSRVDAELTFRIDVPKKRARV